MVASGRRRRLNQNNVMTDEQDILQRVTRMEALFDSLVGEVAEIKNNHLSHITEELKEIRGLVGGHPSWSVTLVISGLAALVALLIPLVLQK